MSSTPEYVRPAISGVISAPISLWSAGRGEVEVVAGVGGLVDLVADLRRAVLVALAEDPRAVVCDLTGVTDGSDADARLLVETIGQQVRDWPAVPVALPCPNADLRQRLRHQPLSEHVLLRTTVRQAMAAVGCSAPPATARMQLSPHVTASRVARDFVSRTCLDWGLAPAIASACLVVSELATNGLRHAVTDMDLSLACHGGTLRLALRDHSDSPLRPQAGDLESVGGRGLALVAACSRAWGVLPTADGGKVVWAVLDVRMPDALPFWSRQSV
jgi:hypothetical protein